MKILVNDIFKILIENKIDNKTITEIHTQLLGHKKEFDNDINKNDLISIIHLFESTFPTLSKNEIINKIYKKECYFYACKLYEQITDQIWRKEQLDTLFNICGYIENYENLHELSWLIPQDKYDNNKPTPIYWQKNFELYKTCLKGTYEQGSKHGPDFIFFDSSNNYKIGVEFARAEIDTLDIVNPKKFNDKKYIDKAWKKILKIDKYGVSKDTISLLIDVLKKHVNNLNKYENCDEYYLVLKINKRKNRLWWWFYEEYLNIYKWQYYAKEKRNYKYIYVA